MPTFQLKRFDRSELENDRGNGYLSLRVKQRYVLFIVTLIYALQGLGSNVFPFLTIQEFHICVLRLIVSYVFVRFDITLI